MIEFAAGLLILVGGAFSLIAGIGLVRLPDLYVRMHAATKAGTLGAGLVLAALALESQQLEVAARALAGVVFLFFTAPIAAHLLGRAGYIAGVPLWSQSCRDELEGKYDPETRSLKGAFPDRTQKPVDGPPR
jgi:multicomponent Na+:H+ antiporter subunit G